MLRYLFAYLDQLDIPGAGMFQYISFRSSMSIITSLIISMIIGKYIIGFLKKKQIQEGIRDLGLEGQKQKEKTPTMGGIIIIASIIIPTLLFADIKNVYVILMIITTLWLGTVGFIDDYIKVFKKDKRGLAGIAKVVGQVGLGLIVGLTMYKSNDVVIRELKYVGDSQIMIENRYDPPNKVIYRRHYLTTDVKSTKTTMPFRKNNEGDYAGLVAFMGEKDRDTWAWIAFIVVSIFIITAVSNSANMTDGLDGLAAGTSAIAGATLGVFAYVSGNIIYADYLNIMYIPNTGELVVFISAFIGALVGFFWYNSYPAQIFMGDTGSLSIGGIIAVLAIIIRKEMLIPILCGIFFIESLSVLLQVSWFKFTKMRTGTGKRILKMAPLHHHYQVLGYAEPKIVTRFIIVGLLLAVLTVLTLKIR